MEVFLYDSVPFIGALCCVQGGYKNSLGKKDEEENKKQVFQVKKLVGLPPILEILAPFGRCCVIKIIYNIVATATNCEIHQQTCEHTSKARMNTND